MLYEAVIDDDDVDPRPDIVLADPKVSVYLDGWGRDGDIGVIAEEGSTRRAGAAWSRLYSNDSHGWGFVDSSIPEISIAVVEEFRGRRVGRILMNGLIERSAEAGFTALSLSMDPADAAASRLYEGSGFRRVGKNRDLVVMKLDL